MHLQRLRLLDYRNIAAAELELDAQFTVLWGHNGAGKTNVLEAIYLVSTLRSFRTSDLAHLIRKGSEGARVELVAHDPVAGIASNLSVRLERTARSARRTAQLDDKTVRAAKDFYGRVRAVLFTPEDLGILRGSPAGRRQFIDRVLFARERAHITDIQDYEKLLRSRNRVLKAEAGAMSTTQRHRLLDTYDVGLADLGARIWTRRASLLEDLAPGFEASFAQIHDVGDGPPLRAGLRYVARARRYLDDGPATQADVVSAPDPASEDARRVALARILERRRAVDLERRSTTVGPHLDELEVTLDGELAGEFASQGQSRALVLAFKIAELRSARSRFGAPPLLLLDDVSSELDPRRNAQLFETLRAEVGQCILTTTSPDYIRLGDGVDRLDLPVAAGAIEAPRDPRARAEPSTP